MTHLGFQGSLTIPGIPSEVFNSFKFLGKWSPRTEHRKSAAILDHFGYCYSQKPNPCSNSKQPQVHSAGSGPTGKKGKAVLSTVPWCHPPVYVQLVYNNCPVIFQPVFVSIHPFCQLYITLLSHFSVLLDHPCLCCTKVTYLPRTHCLGT